MLCRQAGTKKRAPRPPPPLNPRTPPPPPSSPHMPLSPPSWLCAQQHLAGRRRPSDVRAVPTTTGQSAEQVAWPASGAISVAATTSLTIQWELPQTDNATTLYTVFYSSVTNGDAEVTVSLSDADAISAAGTLISPVSLTLANLKSGTE